MYHHNNPAVVSTTTALILIVAGGWGHEREKAPVEVMDTKTICWSEVACLPHIWSEGTATICGCRIYVGGGVQDNVKWSV